MLSGNLQLLSLDAIGCVQDLPETSDTLQGNAYQKAAFVKQHFNIDCFADDTGLEVEALDGAPGVYSARYAGPEKNDQANCSKLLQELRTKENRDARFRTVICLIQGSDIWYFEGLVEGTIINDPKGSKGFGYDPLFLPLGQNQTFAEMPLSEKNLISHRAKAVQKLTDFLMSQK